ncbi:MAG: hypothetical protein ACYCVD_05825 [Desulfitobacteriaceae bacterium]
MKNKWRTLLIWIIISLTWQFSAYTYLNNKVEAVMLTPSVVQKPITQRLVADIPGTNLEDIQLSYAKDFLAYKQNGVFKVYNLKQKKVAFEKPPAPGSEKSMGVLNYEWLPDRNTLIYFYARKNPNPVTTVIIQPTPAPQPPKVTPEIPSTEDPNQHKTDPNQQKINPNEQKAEKDIPPTGPKVEKHYNNPQLTELYTLELPNSENEIEKPDDRFNQTLNSFPAGGQITQMGFSTFTNLMYLMVKSGSSTQILQIDVMKEVKTLSRSGETITNMTASDHFGTLYMEVKSGGTKQIVAVDGWQRKVISSNPNDSILGDRSGTLYIGEVKNGILEKILSLPETAAIKEEPNLNTIWNGSIPYKDTRVQIGAQKQVIVYTHETAYIINKGDIKTLNLHGEQNYISVDGAELVQLTREGNYTRAELQPLEN